MGGILLVSRRLWGFAQLIDQVVELVEPCLVEAAEAGGGATHVW